MDIPGKPHRLYPISIVIRFGLAIVMAIDIETELG